MRADVRFGSLGDILGSPPHVRLAPDNDRKSGHRRCQQSATRRHQPDYSITSSARASNVGGTVRPSALAVLRLITSSYLVGACTGTGLRSIRNSAVTQGQANREFAILQRGE